MKVIIFGATGGTGKQLVLQALEMGLYVTAFLRNPEKMNIQHPNLVLFIGDVLNYEQVENAMFEQDAVLCTLGFGKQINSKSLVHSLGTLNILNAMKVHKVALIICETSILVGDALQGISTFGKLYIKLMNWIVPHFLQEKEKQEKLIKASNFKWVIVRPSTLTDGAKTGVYQVGHKLKTTFSSKISRADVADFMLKQLHSNQYIHQSPTIKY